MIAKLTTGNGFSGAALYDLRLGGAKAKPTSPGDVKILGLEGNINHTVNDKGEIIVDVRQLGRDFRFQAMMRPMVRKPVHHWALSWKKGERITDKEMLKRSKEFMTAMGYVNTQYIIIRHKKENEHCHIIANIVNYDGNRISTDKIIERAHHEAKRITKQYGYAWGESAKKETIQSAHKPHEKVRYIIEPIVKDAVSKAQHIRELPTLLKTYGIQCNIKYSETGKPVGISFAYEMDGQLHTFKGSDLDRTLSAGNITKSIAERQARMESRHEAERIGKVLQMRENGYSEMKDAYKTILSPIEGKLITLRDSAYRLYKESKEAGANMGAKTNALFGELDSLWNQYNKLNSERRNAKADADIAKAIGGMLMFMNPIVGLTVLFIAQLTGDIRQSDIRVQKAEILEEVIFLREMIADLENQKKQMAVMKTERLNDYLQAKQKLKEYREGLTAINQNIQVLQYNHDYQIEKLKKEFPNHGEGQLYYYIIHGPIDASIYRLDNITSDEKLKRRGEDEVIRKAMLEKVLMVSGMQGAEEFYNNLLEMRKNGRNYRVGNIFTDLDGKISFGKEHVFGDPEMTMPYLPKKDEQRVKEPVPRIVAKPRRKPKMRGLSI